MPSNSLTGYALSEHLVRNVYEVPLALHRRNLFVPRGFERIPSTSFYLSCITYFEPEIGKEEMILD